MYEKESEILKHVLRAKGLSEVCIRAEQLAASGRSTMITKTGQMNQDTLETYYIKDIIIVGSSAEGLKLDSRTRQEQYCDTDCIILYQQFEVIEAEDSARAASLGASYVLMKEDETYPGYAKLVVPPNLAGQKAYDGFTETIGDEAILMGNMIIKKYMEFLLNVTKESNIETHGPAVTLTMDNHTAVRLLTKCKGNMSDDLGILTDKKYRTDIVPSPYYSGWPQQAEGWISRKSSSNWPTKYLKASCVKKGCILAPVGPKDSPYQDKLWRISFNQAEQLLVESFNETQLHCLVLLKYLKINALKNIPGKNITSYHLKTTMFWCMEEVEESEWKPVNLIKCLVECLKLLQKWLSARFMPNYFIEKRNMFESELTESIFEQLSSVLDTIISDPCQEIKMIEQLQWKDDETTLRVDGAKMDIECCVAFRTNMAMGFLLFESTQKPEGVESTAAQNAVFVMDPLSKIFRSFLGSMYDVRSTLPGLGTKPFDCLALISKVLDQKAPEVTRSFAKLSNELKKEYSIEILDKYKQILWTDLVKGGVKGNLRETIKNLRRVAGSRDCGLAQILVAHLDLLDHIFSKRRLKASL